MKKEVKISYVSRQPESYQFDILDDIDEMYFGANEVYEENYCTCSWLGLFWYRLTHRREVCVRVTPYRQNFKNNCLRCGKEKHHD